MALPTSGKISADQVAQEVNWTVTGKKDLGELPGRCNNSQSPVQVDKIIPYDSDSFFGYNHSYRSTVEDGDLTLTNPVGQLGETGMYEWSATATGVNVDNYGEFLVRYRINGGSWTSLHSSYLTVEAFHSVLKTGTIFINGMHDDASVYEFQHLFKNVLLDSVSFLVESGGEPL